MSGRWHRGRVLGVVFSSVWLVYLAFPVTAMLTSTMPPAVKVAHTLAVVVFAAL